MNEIHSHKQQQQPFSGFCSISRLCNVSGINPSAYYRWEKALPILPFSEDASIKREIEDIIEEFPGYGYRRTTKELHRRAMPINHKRVSRIMREHGLICKRKKRFIHTTDSNHTHRVYPNLTKDLELSDINQLWVADITYVKLPRRFVYLAVVLDAYSRRCIGWSLGSSLESGLAIEALEQAFSRRLVPEGLIHHSDRGVQYACNDYIQLLSEHGVRISMSRRGNPYDNAKAESFMKTLKCEEVYLMDYETEADAAEHIEIFIEAVYNQKRLHSSIGYVPPAEFEAGLIANEGEIKILKVVDLDDKIA